MRYALIDTKKNLVVNVIEVEPGDGTKAPAGSVLVQSDSANIGDGWDGASIVKKPEPPFVPRQ